MRFRFFILESLRSWLIYKVFTCMLNVPRVCQTSRVCVKLVLSFIVLVLSGNLSNVFCDGGLCAGMGESNCAWNRRSMLHRDTVLAAAAVYKGESTESTEPNL